MIPFTTCMRYNRKVRGTGPGGVEWSVQVQVPPAGATAPEAGSTIVAGDAATSAALPGHSQQGQQQTRAPRRATAGDIHIHIDHPRGDGDDTGDEDNSTLMSSPHYEDETTGDEGSLTLSARIVGGRRRSSSSIRFADDTDTGTDILIITEENLEDILSDPIYGDLTLPRRRRSRHSLGTPSGFMPFEVMDPASSGLLAVPSSRHHHVKRMSLVPPFHHRHLLQGIHGMCIGGSGAQAYSGQVNDEDRATQNRILLTLRRRKSANKSIHIDPIALLDYSYHGITERFLKNAASWHFNSFTLDTMTGGHSLSELLFYLFKKYELIDHFKLDIVCVWKCFRLFEAGYHDTNPYHNSVHAADVTQAMHCFIQEKAIGPHLSSMERMCAILAAVGHDLDHPGVSQQFLIATNSHLAALYNNLSVLESHHWRFAVSCLHESHIFEHFTDEQWTQVKYLVRSLIMATDITQQANYLARFRAVLGTKAPLSMSVAENRLFVMQLALKCADLANPCRPWMLSKRWSEQICSEFYRQGDFERQLELPVTPMCNRYKASMAKIQTDFFRNVVTPLFELWDQFLSSKLSRQLIANLRFNNNQWESFLDPKVIGRRHSSTCPMAAHAPPASAPKLAAHSSRRRRSTSFNDINYISEMSSLSLNQLREWYQAFVITATRRSDEGDVLDPAATTTNVIPAPVELPPGTWSPPPSKKAAGCDGVHGCGTPPTTGSISPIAESPTCLSLKSSKSSTDSDKPIYVTAGRIPIVSCQAPLSPGCGTENEPPPFGQFSSGQQPTTHPLSPFSTQMFINKAQYLSGRRGSAPGCIGVYTSCELAAAALVFLQGAIKGGQAPRRSSAPVEANKSRKNSNNSSHSSGAHSHHSERAHNAINQIQGAKLNWPAGGGGHQRGRSLEVLMTSLTAKTGGFYGPHSAANVHHHGKFLRRQACSLDSSSDCCQQWLYTYAGKPRRGSVPQEVLIESLSKYPSHGEL